MRDNKFKYSISIISLISAINFSSIALADGLSGGAIYGDSYVGVALDTGDVDGGNVSAINYSDSSPVVDIMGGATNEGNANKNNVTLTGTILSGQVSGGYSHLGNTDNNIVTLTSSQIGGDVNGGFASTGNATSNAINMTDGLVTSNVYGGYVDITGAVSQNSVTISGAATINGFVYGGFTASGTATGNQLSIQGGSLAYVYGGRTADGDALSNKVIISGGEVSKSVYGGQAAAAGVAQNNIITMTGGNIQGELFGGLSLQGKAIDNSVLVSGGTVGTNVIGGFGSGDGGSAVGNEVNISDTAQVNAFTVGGYVETGAGEVTSNKVTISGGNIDNEVFGGRSANGAATDNKVLVSNGSIIGVVYGGYSDGNGLVQANNVEITGGTLGNNIFGGYAISGDAKDNSVTVSGGLVQKSVMGGYSDMGGAVSGNSVTISNNAQITEFVVGGYNPNGDATDNNITVNGGQVGQRVYGGRSTSGNVTGNTVTITDGSIIGNVYGANAEGAGYAENNSVTINGGQAEQQVYGGRSTSGNVSGNKITMTGGAIAGNIYAGVAGGAGSSTDNSIIVTGGSLGHDVSGGWSNSGAVTNNTVSISNATVERNLGGGYVENGGSDALNNSVTLSNSTHIKGYVVGGFTASGSANNNSITLENTAVDNNTAVTGSGAIDGAIYGGYTRDGNATGNIITLNGENIKLGGAIYGGFDAAGNGDAFTGNTLNLNGYRGSVAGIYNVENYNWLLPKNVTSNDAALIHITGNDAVNLDNTKHSVALYNDGNVLNTGDTIYLIDKAIGTPTLTTTQVQQGQFLVYDMAMSVEGDDLVLTVGGKNDTTPVVPPVTPVEPETPAEPEAPLEPETPVVSGTPNSPITSVKPVGPVVPSVPNHSGVNINPRTKAFSEGRVASLGFTAQGADLIASSISGIRLTAAQADKIALVPFVVTEGSSQNYKTGSSVDIKGFHMAAGLATRHVFEAGHQLTVGAFFEYGQGTYDTFNSFSNYASVRGDGNTHYTGGGVLGRIDIAGTGLGRVTTIAPYQADGLYLEASIRAGRVKNKYDASNLIDPEGFKGEYDSSVSYFGAHGAVGYVFNFDEKQSIDAYARYLYTHMGSDTVTIGKDRLHFDTSTSSRIQIGGRYSYQYNEQVKPYIGAAYEYEAKGDASAKAYGMKLDKPSLEGSSGIFEAGLSFKPLENYKNIAVDVNGRGYVGEHKGGGGNIKLSAQF